MDGNHDWESLSHELFAAQEKKTASTKTSAEAQASTDEIKNQTRTSTATPGSYAKTGHGGEAPLQAGEAFRTPNDLQSFHSEIHRPTEDSHTRALKKNIGSIYSQNAAVLAERGRSECVEHPTLDPKDPKWITVRFVLEYDD